MAELQLEGEIFEAKDIVRQIKAVSPGEPLTLNVNTPGGNVWLGMDIGEALAQHRGETTLHSNGLVASMGFFLLSYVDKATASPGAQFMIHPASLEGDQREHPAVVEGNAYMRARMKKRGVNAELVKAVFDGKSEETEFWFTAASAKENKIIDEVITTSRRNNAPVRLTAQAKPSADAMFVGANGAIAPLTAQQMKNPFKKGEKNMEARVMPLIAEDGSKLFASYTAADGELVEGVKLTPVEGAELTAGTPYAFEAGGKKYSLTLNAEEEVATLEETEEEGGDDKTTAEMIEANNALILEKMGEMMDEKLSAVTTKGSLKARATDQELAGIGFDAKKGKGAVADALTAKVRERQEKKKQTNVLK